MSQSDELFARYIKLKERDEVAQTEVNRVRFEQLKATGDDQAAARQVGIEQLCRDRLFLPREGLGRVHEVLVAAGFYFANDPVDSSLVLALFPDGWQLVAQQFPEYAGFAYLVDPQGHNQAFVCYEDLGGGRYRTYINRP